MINEVSLCLAGTGKQVGGDRDMRTLLAAASMGSAAITADHGANTARRCVPCTAYV